MIEAVLTFLLMTVIMGTAVDNRAPAGIAGFGIGLVVMADILMGGPLTGAAMNLHAGSVSGYSVTWQTTSISSFTQ